VQLSNLLQDILIIRHPKPHFSLIPFLTAMAAVEVLSAPVMGNTHAIYDTDESLLITEEFYLLIFFVLGFVVFRTKIVQNWLDTSGTRRALHKAAEIKAAELASSSDIVLSGDESSTTASTKDTETSSVTESEEEKPCSGQSTPPTPGPRTLDTLRGDIQAGRHTQVLYRWAEVRLEYLGEASAIAVFALLALGRGADVGLFLGKAGAKRPQVWQHLHKTIAEVAKSPSDSDDEQVAVRFAALRSIFDKLRNELDVAATEALAIALAERGDQRRTAGLLQRLASLGKPATAAVVGDVARRFLACGQIDAAVSHLDSALALSAQSPGSVPSDLIVAVPRHTTEGSIADQDVSSHKRTCDVLRILEGVGIEVPLPQEAFVVLLEWAARQSSLDLHAAQRTDVARRTEALLRAHAVDNTALPAAAYDALVRIHAVGDDASQAMLYFDELVAACVPAEASLVGMLSACLEDSNAELAEHIFAWAQSHERCTAVVLSAAAKVRTTSERKSLTEDMGAEDEAEAIVAPKPLSLSRVCSQAALEVATVPQAAEALRKLEANDEADTSAFNYALDACVTSGDTSAVRTLFREMCIAKRVDAISFNILLKQLTDGASSGQARKMAAECDALLVDAQAWHQADRRHVQQRHQRCSRSVGSGARLENG